MTHTRNADIFEAKLGDLYLHIRPLPDWGKPIRTTSLVTNALADLPRQGPLDSWSAEPRTLSFEVRQIGVAADGEPAAYDLTRQLHDLNLELLKDTNTLTVWPRQQQYPVDFHILRNQGPGLPDDWAFEHRAYAFPQVTLTAEPFTFGTPNTNDLGALSSPCLVALDLDDGELAGPVELLIERAWSGSTNGIRQAIIGLVGDPTLTIDDLLFATADAESGWTTDTDANARGATIRKTTSLTWTDLHWTARPKADTYRVYAVAKCDHDAIGSYLGIGESESTEPYSSTQVTADTWQAYDLGPFEASGFSDIVLWGKRVGGTSSDYVLVDYLLFVPVSGHADFTCDDYHVKDVTLAGRDSFLTEVNTQTRSALLFVKGRQLMARGAGSLLVLVLPEAGSGAAGTNAFGAHETHTCRYLMWRPADALEES